MRTLKYLLTTLTLIAFFAQPVSATTRYSVDEMANCVPVGDIAMKAISFKKQGFQWEYIKTSVTEHIRTDLIIWVALITALVMSSQSESSEKIVKRAIRYCLRTNKRHSKIETTLSI